MKSEMQILCFYLVVQRCRSTGQAASQVCLGIGGQRTGMLEVPGLIPGGGEISLFFKVSVSNETGVPLGLECKT